MNGSQSTEWLGLPWHEEDGRALALAAPQGGLEPAELEPLLGDPTAHPRRLYPRRSSAPSCYPLAATMSIVCLGEALVDLILLPGRRGEPERFAAYAGGALANVAVAVARAGAPAALAGGSGRDAFGRFLRRSLTAEGVDVDRLGEIEDLITPFAFVRTDAEGEPEFRIHGDGIDAGLAPLRGNEGEVFERGGRAGDRLEHPRRRARAERHHRLHRRRERDARCRSSSIRTCGPADGPDLETAIGRCRDVAASATVIKANAAEARLLTGAADADPEAAAGALLELGPSLAVVTAGPAGRSLGLEPALCTAARRPARSRTRSRSEPAMPSWARSRPGFDGTSGTWSGSPRSCRWRPRPARRPAVTAGRSPEAVHRDDHRQRRRTGQLFDFAAIR